MMAKMQGVFKVGSTEIIAVVHQQRSAKPTMLNVHHDEETSVSAGKTNIKQFGGRVIELTHPGQRLVTFALEGVDYSFDPNRIFSDTGITATLNKHSTYSAAAHSEIKRFADDYLRTFELDSDAVIVALHNTTDGIFSVKSFAASGQFAAEAAAVHVSAQRSEFDFFFVTEQRFFDYLRGRDFNVVLQHEKPTDDGSLSVHFARKNIPYINVEAEMAHLKAQIAMLTTTREMLREFQLAS